MAKIYLYDCDSREMHEEESLETAAEKALKSKTSQMIKLDLSDGIYPEIKDDSCLKTYTPKVKEVGSIRFSSRYGWMCSIHPNGNDTSDVFSGDFIGNFDIDLFGYEKSPNLWLYIWPIDGEGMPLGL